MEAIANVNDSDNKIDFLMFSIQTAFFPFLFGPTDQLKLCQVRECVSLMLIVYWLFESPIEVMSV